VPLYIGLGSFAAAGVFLAGLLCYDAFWVFGSGSLFGDGVGDNVMMAVATSNSFQGPFRLLAPVFEDVLNPRPLDAPNFGGAQQVQIG